MIIRCIFLLSLLRGISSQAGLCKWCPTVFPNWPVQWALMNSTIVEPCNSNSFINPSSVSDFQIVCQDWSNMKNQWVQGRPMDAETPALQQAALLSAANSHQRVWIYKNINIAYPWFPSVREKMVDPAYSDWFIKFGPPPLPNSSYHVPPCDKNYDPPLCSQFYHSQDQTPGYPTGDGDCPAPACDCGGVPCGFYLFNSANASLREWIVDEYVMGPTGIGAPGGVVQGVYLDDHWSNFSDPTDAPDCASGPIGGPTEVNVGCINDTSLTQANTTAISDGFREVMLTLQQRIIAAGAYSWAYFTEVAGGASSSRPACISFFRNNGTELYSRALMMSLSKNSTGSLQRDLATFLAVRGPYAWLGRGWQGCDGDPSPLPPEFFLDYGVPVNNITEVSEGVFERLWTKATVTFNCTSWEGNIIMN